MAILQAMTNEARDAMPDGVAICGDCDDEVGRGDLYHPAAEGRPLRCAGCAEAAADASAELARDAYRTAQRTLALIQRDIQDAN